MSGDHFFGNKAVFGGVSSRRGKYLVSSLEVIAWLGFCDSTLFLKLSFKTMSCYGGSEGPPSLEC